MAASDTASISNTGKLSRTVNKPKEYPVTEGPGFLMWNVSFILPFYFHSVSLGTNKFAKWSLEGYMTALYENAEPGKEQVERRTTEAKGKPWRKK